MSGWPYEPDETKACAPIPCPPFTDAILLVDDSYVPTLDEVRQFGCAVAGPDDRFYVERDGRVVLLRALRTRTAYAVPGLEGSWEIVGMETTDMGADGKAILHVRRLA